MRFLSRLAAVGFGFLLSTTVLISEARAVILDQSENFNDGNFANNDALAAAGYVFSDPLASGLDGLQPSGDADTGDGLDDGGIFIDGLSIEGTVTYPFVGTIEDGAEYMFGAQLFKSSLSFVQAEVELLAGGAVVASTPSEVTITGNAASPNGLIPATLFYRGDAGTAGQTLSFRVRQTRGFDGSFDVGIDNWALEEVDLSAPIADQFETFTGFAPFGYTWTLSGAYTENSNEAASPASGIYPGDSEGDGAIFVDGNNGGPPTSLIEYRFDGSIEDGQKYDFGAYLFQPSTSFGETTVELVADPGGPNETIVSSVSGSVFGRTTSPSDTLFNLFELSYTGDATTAGQGLGFRVSSERPAGGGSSDVGIDGWWLALASGLSGDFNANGVVDAADYTVWLGALGGDEAALNGNGDGSGTVDIGDYALWKSSLGNSAGTGALTRNVVPEPNSLVALLVVVITLPTLVKRPHAAAGLF